MQKLSDTPMAYLVRGRKFIAKHLQECCEEILEWDRTALLRDHGKVREAAMIYMGGVASTMNNALSMVRSEVALQAMTYVTHSGG